MTPTDQGNDTPKGTNGSGLPVAGIAGLLGKDTRPIFKLNGLDGKPLKVPSLEESAYLQYCELRLMRLQFEILSKAATQLVNQGRI